MEIDERQLQTYSAVLPPTSVPDSNSRTTRLITTTSKSATTSTKTVQTHTGTATTRTTATSSSTSSSTPTDSFKFVELFEDTSIYSIYEDQFQDAPFETLCPSGNCIADCQDYSRLFSALPSGIAQDVATYGRPDANNQLAVTFFGLCSNLGNASVAAQAQEASNAVKTAFVAQNGSLNDQVSRVASTIATCFASTCEQTRDPNTCAASCSAAKLLQEGAAGNSLDIGVSMRICASQLCQNTCGLPYADQDVLGIGVLVSYYVQALLVLLVAAALIGSLVWRLWRSDNTLGIHHRLERSLESFATAQAYFGVSAAIASFVMHPATVDPLNGYALVSVSITGFLPVIFTLMLLHSHGIKSWFSTALVSISWLLNTIVFFMLFKNLWNSQGNQAVFDEGLNNLFATASCGGQSAMSLCQQLQGTNPLAYLTGFFNKDTIPNIRTVPILWGWATFVLLVLVVRQALRPGLQRDQTLVGGYKPEETTEMPRPSTKPLIFWLFFLAVVVFSLCLGYQFVMVNSYRLMDVIDFDGWSFGQVVAVLFWIPPALEFFRSVLDRDHHRTRNVASSGDKPQTQKWHNNYYSPIAVPPPSTTYAEHGYNEPAYSHGAGSPLIVDPNEGRSDMTQRNPVATEYTNYQGYMLREPTGSYQHGS